MFKPDHVIKELDRMGFKFIAKEKMFRGWEIWTDYDGKTWYTQVAEPKPSRLIAIATPINPDAINETQMKVWDTQFAA